MNKPYALTKSNRVVLFIGSILILGATLISPDNIQVLRNPESEMLGKVVGEIIAKVLMALFFPAVIGWCVWRLKGRKENAGSFTFNLLFILAMLIVVISALGKVQGRIDSAKGVHDLQQDIESYQSQIASADNPEEVSDLQQRFAQNIDDKLESLKSGSLDNDKKLFYSITQEVVRDASARESDWQTAFARTQENDILDITVLDDEQAYKNQISVIMNYKEKSRSQGAYVAEVLPTMMAKVNDSEISEKIAKSYIKGMQEANEEKQKIAQPLFRQHQKYADEMLKYLNFLYAKKGSWKLVDGLVAFEDATLEAEFNTIVSSFTASEAELNRMMQSN